MSSSNSWLPFSSKEHRLESAWLSASRMSDKDFEMYQDALISRLDKEDIEVLRKYRKDIIAWARDEEDLIPRADQEYPLLVLSRIRTYQRQSSRMRVIHSILQITILIGAALVTVLVSIETPKFIPAIFSGVITIAAALESYFKFSERSRVIYLTAENMAQEYNWFITKQGPYQEISLDKFYNLFYDRIEALIRRKTQQTFALDQMQEKQK